MYDQETVDEFIFRSENFAKNIDKYKAFLINSQEIDICEDRYLNEHITELNFLHNDKAFDWIKSNIYCIKNIRLNCGY